MEKTLNFSDKTNLELKFLHDQICDEYAKRFCDKYDFYFEDGFWVSDLRGGVFCTSDMEYSLSMEDIKLIIDNDVPYETFVEWWNYNLGITYAQENHQDETNKYHDINLYSWLKGYRGEFTKEELKQEEENFWSKYDFRTGKENN